MTVWHVGDELAGRYAAGTAAETDAWSLEKHVEACAPCAARVSASVREQGDAAPLLEGVRAAVLATATAEPVRGTSWGRARGRRWGPARLLGRGVAPRAWGHPGARGPERPWAREPVRTWGRPEGEGPASAWGRPGARGPGRGPVRGRLAWSAPGPATRIGRVLWAAGPALRGSWAAALVLVALGAVALAYGGGLGGTARPLLLVVAPVLPLAGVGVSYGRSADPMHEITATAPGGGLRLLLVRTAAVLAVTVPVLTLAWAVLPASAGGPGAVAWLLPGLAMTLAALALSSYVGCRTGASSVAACWALAVAVPAVGTLPARLDEPLAAAVRYFAGPAAQSSWAAAAVLCAGLLALRRRSFDHLEKS
ncbi:hypothetical protein AB0N93_00970 [Streptomyces sp. NPDC091267]|uniref:hypothetical protein n=1 Tax=Streptomyces sp. NPDC091267 TaxID=3155195 RepID=UPI00343E1D6E